MKEIIYNREKATAYAQKWAYKRNPVYYDFENIGGDCTNFVSQCIYAGGGVMNYTPVLGWYYNSSDDRSPSWTDVDYLFEFLIENISVGPRGEVIEIENALVGDIIQFGDKDDDFYHSLIITKIVEQPSPESIFVTTHSFDANMRQLATYYYEKIRFIHINSVWKYN